MLMNNVIPEVDAEGVEAEPAAVEAEWVRRHADLSLAEDDLMSEGRHVLVTYIMKPRPGYDYLELAAWLAAESSMGAEKQ